MKGFSIFVKHVFLCVQTSGDVLCFVCFRTNRFETLF